ncbi:Regulator of rDNA transcription protein 15 [Capsicum baccatum]|uniref:Regulator of rDNA transcription protein 15 n=1 Tax=Capsicum baccatum TaxID=33114 RepID=A0A2G2UXQ8_CAPBA|nr:Regulator of rDNA transcription protein 15 [Capsicum baccatum]
MVVSLSSWISVHRGTKAGWHRGAMAPRHRGAMAPRHHGSVAPWHQDPKAPRHRGAMVPWRHGTVAPWHRGAMAPLRHGTFRARGERRSIKLDNACSTGNQLRASLHCACPLTEMAGKGSRQNGSVSLGKGLAMRAGHRGPSPEPVGCQWTARAAPVGKTNLSHDGLNPAHVPYWWVNNPTLGEFCFTMIGRADIEGSKSNVAMNVWLPQASYPCGNFFDTSTFEFRRSKGSLGHAFTVRIRTGSQNQTSFYPSVPHEISVLVELILGHLRYLLTDVPPQPNSPPDNVFRPDRPAERALGPKRGAVPRFRFTE